MCISCRPHGGGGGSGSCGQGEGFKNPIFVDVINGWPLRKKSVFYGWIAIIGSLML